MKKGISKGWPSGGKRFSFVVTVLFIYFFFSGTENHISLPKEDKLLWARKLNLQTDGDGTSPS